ncbi:MAG: S-layer homology domain-containing protein [bacterium]|nr:S-layer homology domain-containing protein [bacterium]
MPLIARQRSRLAVLAVLALVGSLLAVSAVPAVAAKDEKPTATAMYKACVAAATEDAGFTDTVGNFAEDAINCLSHYGIAQGTSTEEMVFSPNDSILRSQMASFMKRAAGVAGIELDDPEDQGLGDIGNWTDDIQDAINQVVAAEIMSGDSNDMFNPTASVSRADMAVILDAFLMAADVDLEDDFKVKDADIDTPFDDINGVPVSAYHAINRLYEFGVAEGKGDGSTFDPDSLVSRAQMAAFVTRALDHTNARPAGVTVQGMAMGDAGTSHDITISVRDMDHQPVPDALVDVISTTKPDEAFDDDGACVMKNVTGNCEITTGDEATDPDGNTDGVTVMLPDAAGTLKVLVWTGEAGDKFDMDDTEFAPIEIDVALPADMIEVTDDMKKNSNFLKFGDTVTYTLQVVNSDDEPVAEKDLEVTIQAVIMDTTPLATGDDGTGQLRPTTSTSSKTYKTDAAGRIEVPFTQDDPDGDTDNRDRVTLTLTLTRTGNPALDSSGVNDHDMAEDSVTTDNIFQAIWADDDVKATTLTLSQRVMYHETNDDGVANTLMATLVDQYGDPVRSQKVAVWSDAANPATGSSEGLGRGSAVTDASPAGPGSAADPADRRTTSRRGVATKTYDRSATDPDTEVLNAQYIRIVGCEDAKDEGADETCFDTDGTTPQANDEPIDADDTVNHYWAKRVDGDSASGAVLVADKDNNSIVVTATVDGVTGPWLVTYKAGDQFSVGGAAATMEAFEKALKVADPDATPAVVASIAAVIGDDEDDINTFDFTTS